MAASIPPTGNLKKYYAFLPRKNTPARSGKGDDKIGLSPPLGQKSDHVAYPMKIPLLVRAGYGFSGSERNEKP